METNRLFAACGDARQVVLTNQPDSPIAALSSTVFDLMAGPELGGVACRTFTHTLVALLTLEAALSPGSLNVGATARAAADACDHLLATRDPWLAPTIELLAGPHGTWLLAPVERLCSSLQGALMLREGPRLAAVGCETGDWSHVDVYLTKTLDYLALVFAGARHTVRYPLDTDPIVALLTEVMVPELVAASLWQQQATTPR
ncbi:MAG: hypothetical protein RLZZ623_1506 [Actinomycetota bacterium]